MKDKLSYKGFIGSVHFNGDDNVFYGKIEGISDLVTFEGESVRDLLISFEEACEDYLQLCEQVNKKPAKSYKGSFNVRIPHELHRLLADKAVKMGVSINRVVQAAIEREVGI